MTQIFFNVFIGIVASLTASLAIILFLWLLMLVMRCIYRKTSWYSRTVRIEISSIAESNKMLSETFLEALYTAFTHFRQALAVIEGRLAIRDSGLSYFTDCAHLLPSAENIDIQVEVGPVRLGNIVGLLSRYIGKREFICRISVKGDSTSGYSIFAGLSMNRKLWNTWHHQIDPSDIDDYCQRLIREIVWVTSRRNTTEAQLVGYWKQYELNLLEGLEHLSLYLEAPAHVGPLMEAVDSFEKAKHEPWIYQADLLSAISVSLAQREPRMALQQMQNLLNRYSHLRRRKVVLLYNTAVAHFRLYDIDGDSRHYDDAISLFESIKPPRLPLWLPIRRRARILGLVLHLLSRVGIANCLTHKLNVSVGSEKEQIITKVQAINKDVIDLVQHYREKLGLTADEIEWRVFNAETIIALYGLLDAEKGIEAARKGLNIDPQNLPLKANLGSLILLKTRQAEERGDAYERTTSLKQADQIFLELQGAGWDPGFINYRLGRIRRLQRKFSKAITLLESAKNRDVANKRIEEEISKARARNSHF